MVVDPAVYQPFIASAGITPSPVSPAIAFPYRGGRSAARFPITGVAAPATVTHAGGLTRGGSRHREIA